MSAMKNYSVLILNGPNLRFVGQRDPGTYGSQAMETLVSIFEQKQPELAARVNWTYFQANGEGELIDELERAWQAGVQGLIINPGAYTHTSLALADCLAWIGIPCVEVHLSNVWGREEIRRRSLTAAHSLGVIAGFGIMSYVLGMEALVWHLDRTQTGESS